MVFGTTVMLMVYLPVQSIKHLMPVFLPYNIRLSRYKDEKFDKLRGILKQHFTLIQASPITYLRVERKAINIFYMQSDSRNVE